MGSYMPGDWVLLVRQGRHNFEHYYNGPWPISAYYDNYIYSLGSPDGYNLVNKHNGTNLFTNYVCEGHPVRSLLYGSMRILEQNRKFVKSAT